MSDDEDDTHPNIDTGSLFRWRHKARVERMEKEAEDKDVFDKKVSEYVLFVAHLRFIFTCFPSLTQPS